MTTDELLIEAAAIFTEIKNTRRGGFFFFEKMLGDILVERYGIIPTPEMSSSLYRTIVLPYCPFELMLDGASVASIKHVLQSMEPIGIVGFQHFPLTAYFSDARDRVMFKLSQPSDTNLR